MKKRLIPAAILIAYSVVLIEFIVFKNIPVIHIGHMMFRFGGSYQTGDANLVPFKTIWPYLTGHRGRVIAISNVAGNIVPFLPIGFLVPFLYRKMTWLKAVVLAMGTGLAMEGMEVIFRVGIFDIDDVTMNALGVLLGYWVFTLLRPSFAGTSRHKFFAHVLTKGGAASLLRVQA